MSASLAAITLRVFACLVTIIATITTPAYRPDWIALRSRIILSLILTTHLKRSRSGERFLD